MNYEQLAFVNHQLAGMLRAGVPLEGALRQLCAGMARGGLRSELERLEADLARGIPLAEAVAARSLPPFYSSMIQVAARTQDLPSVLTLLADYYQRLSGLSRRIQLLMVYPSIVLIASLATSVLIAFIVSSVARETHVSFPAFDWEGNPIGEQVSMQAFFSTLGTWLPVILLSFLLVAAGLVYCNSRLQQWLRWKLPGFREASLANIAESFELLLGRGVSASDALHLLTRLEGGKPLRLEFERMSQRLASGVSRFDQLTEGSRFFPPLFRWIVGGEGGDWVGGFGRAARLYQARAHQRIETMLYAALPVSVLMLGILVAGQLTPLYLVFSQTITSMLVPLGS